jgi:hypothetical protein
MPAFASAGTSAALNSFASGRTLATIAARAPRRQQQLHLVVGDELHVDAHRVAGVRLVVVLHELDHALPAGDVEPAFGVHLLAPQLVGVELRGCAGGE